MAIFAVIDNNQIVNLIVADSKEIAESVTEKECIEHTEDYQIGMNWYWSEEYSKFISPSPFPSWAFDGNSWNPPVEYPNPDNGIRYFWDEENLSWIPDPNAPTKPAPIDGEYMWDVDLQEWIPVG